MNKLIVGISGGKGSGKDLSAGMIEYILNNGVATANFSGYLEYNKGRITRFKGGKIIAYADKLKDVVSIMFGIDRWKLDDRDYKDNYYFMINSGRFWKKKIGASQTEITIEDLKHNDLTHYISICKSPVIKVRTLLQYVGTDLCRYKLNQNIWINAVNKEIAKIFMSLKYVIISDVRMENECLSLRSLGYDTIVIRLDRKCDKDVSNSHSSEDGIVSYTDIVSNNGTKSQLFYKLLDIIQTKLNTPYEIN